MLECRQLVKSYNSHCVVDHLDFEVSKGETFALLGSNGAGKTTTIKMILGLIQPESGSIQLEDGVTVGYSPETPYFPPFLTGKEVLMYYAGIQKISKEKRQSEVLNLLELVGLSNDKVKVKHYSKGMLQRLALAQAMIGNPSLLILDEPTAGLDALGRIEMMNLLNRLKEQGKTILMNSHILNDIERVCDRGIIMKHGKLVREWSNEELKQGEALESLFLMAVGGMQ